MSASEARLDLALFELPVRHATQDYTTRQTNNGSKSGAQPRRQKRPFFAGPVDMEWLSRAAKLPGAALAVAVMLCHLRKISGKDWIPISNMAIEPFGVSPDAKSRALRALEEAKLVEVLRRNGQSPRVRLIGAME